MNMLKLEIFSYYLFEFEFYTWLGYLVVLNRFFFFSVLLVCLLLSRTMAFRISFVFLFFFL